MAEGGWSKKKRKAFEGALREFLNCVTINSKDNGQIILGHHMFDAQERFITAIFDGLEQDIHDFYCLKSRQLGVSTMTRAFSTFWLGMHEGLTGGIVFDTDANKVSARREIENMIRNLPESMSFPRIVSANRQGITLGNQSTILFMAAGVKKTQSSGTLGRSLGLSYSHASEMCSWSNPEGLVAYRKALSQVHPNRLYIWESTARGYNDWYDMWVEAKADEGQKKCVFLGWWSKPSQQIKKSHPDFRKYGLQPPTEREAEKIRLVKEWYNHQITPEQLAWIRKDSDPLAQAEEGSSTIEYEADSYQLSEQPWTEDDAFQYSGTTFFPPEGLKQMADNWVQPPKKAYSFATYAEFIDTRIHPSANPRQTQLKVWEEPEPGDAFYVVAADPAYGSSEKSDRSAMQVLRCYADGADQVAEYAWPLVGTRQFAWAILAVAGFYASNSNEVRLIIELNGPGRAVWDEIISVRRHIASGYQPKEVDDLGIRRIFANVKNYIYTRNDSLDSGKAWQWNCLSVYEKVPTPHGWASMGDIAIGDKVFDENGQECSVTAVSDIKIGATCYRITFDDGSSIVADDGHLWQVSQRKNKSKIRAESVVRTDQIDPMVHRIAVAKPLNVITDHAPLPLDPYILGVWLGDGDTNSGRITCGTKDLEGISVNLTNAGAVISGVSTDKRYGTKNIRISGLTVDLRKIGLIGNKHIPAQYLRARTADRLSLLRGLMDTDGNVTTDGQCFLHSSNPALVAGIRELIRSLGMKAKVTVRDKKKSFFRGKPLKAVTAFQFYFTAYQDMNPFLLPRKASRVGRAAVPKIGVSRFHKIQRIEQIESVPVRCIQVDSPSHLFLAGEAMVPTHNTAGGTGPASKVRLMERFRDAVSTNKLRIRSAELLDEMRSVQRNEDEIGSEGRLKDDRVIAMAMAVHCWDDRVVPVMSSRKRTREFEANRRRLTIQDMSSLYTKHQFEDLLKRRQIDRKVMLRRMRWAQRGYR